MLQSALDAVHKVKNVEKFNLQIVPRPDCSIVPALTHNLTPWAVGEGLTQSNWVGDTA